MKDIIADLLKPGRDLRDDFEAPVLRQDVLDVKDLVVGQELQGTVRNIVDFGAFVDIGVHEDGLFTFHAWSNVNGIRMDANKPYRILAKSSLLGKSSLSGWSTWISNAIVSVLAFETKWI